MSPLLFAKMSVSEEIRGIVEGLIDKDKFLVDIVLKGPVGAQKLLVLVDSDEGMTIDDCARISRDLSANLDDRSLFDTKYTLEVSSPGLDHPLKLKRQYFKNIGRQMKIFRTNNTQVEGFLRNADDEKIELELKGEKGKDKRMVEIPFLEINKAMVIVSFSKQH